LALRVEVSPTTLEVDPGGVADAAITVHNDGTRVEQVVVTATVEGNSASWMTVQPPTISIYPDTSVKVLLEAAPPQTSEHQARTLPYQIHAQSTLDPQVRGGTGGSVVIGVFHDLTATLSPEHLRTRRGGRCHVAIANNGNAMESVHLTGRGPELNISITRAVQVRPGSRLDVPVKISAPVRWFGDPATLSFDVEVRSDGPSTPSPLRGTVTHLALIPHWVAIGGLALAGIVAAGLGLNIALADPNSVNPVASGSRSIEPSAEHSSAPPVVTSRPPTTPTPTATRTSPAPDPSPSPKPSASVSTTPEPTLPPTQTHTPTRSSARAPASSAESGCHLLEQLATRLHTDQDLVDARPSIQKIIDQIIESPTQDDSQILFYNGFVRNALSADPDGQGWVDAMTSALTDLYTACVDAQYISPA
jgi:hypothetical protein